MTEEENRFIDKSPTLHGPLYLLRRYVYIIFIFGYRVNIRKCYLFWTIQTGKDVTTTNDFIFISKTIHSTDSYIQ